MNNKVFVALYLLSALTVLADSAARPASPPDTLLQMVQAMESSKLGGLTSSLADSGVSYHLRDLHFLGTVRRDGQVYSVAHALFVRSSNPGTDMPPARGHNYIVVFDQKFKIAAHGKTEIGQFRMEGNRLLMDEKEVADLGTTEPAHRHAGFAEINLPYPFADKISDADWEAAGFKKPTPKTHEPAEQDPQNPVDRQPYTFNDVKPKDASDLFLDAYLACMKAEKLTTRKSMAEAIRTYKDADEILVHIQKQFPTWNQKIVEFRRSMIAELLQTLESGKLPELSNQSCTGLNYKPQAQAGGAE